MKLSHDISKFIDYIPYEKISSGWWLSHPSEKYESQLGLFFPIDGTLKKNKPPTRKISSKLVRLSWDPYNVVPAWLAKNRSTDFPVKMDCYT